MAPSVPLPKSLAQGLLNGVSAPRPGWARSIWEVGILGMTHLAVRVKVLLLSPA
jgi:hypothetical protein